MQTKPGLPLLQRGHPLSRGLLAAYTFHEGAGTTLHDVSGHAHHGSLSGTVSWIATSKGPALSFGGGYVTLPTGLMGGLYQWSIVAQVYPTATTEKASFTLGDVSNGSYPTIRFDSAHFEVYTQNSNINWIHNSYTMDVAISANNWYDVALTCLHSTRSAWYLDGSERATTGTFYISSNPLNAGEVARIGGGYNASAVAWPGYVSHLYIYDRELSAGDISALHSDPYQMFRTRSWIAAAVASTAAPGTADISLTWTDNAEHEDGFSIERDTDGGGFSEIDTVAADAESYNDTGVDTGHTYTYRIKATSAALGDSEYSNEAEVTV